MVPWITFHYGWRMAFLATGALGLFWIVACLSLYRRPEEMRSSLRRNWPTSRVIARKLRPPFPGASCCDFRKTWADWTGKVLYRSHLVGLPVLDA